MVAQTLRFKLEPRAFAKDYALEFNVHPLPVLAEPPSETQRRVIVNCVMTNPYGSGHLCHRRAHGINEFPRDRSLFACLVRGRHKAIIAHADQQVDVTAKARGINRAFGRLSERSHGPGAYRHSAPRPSERFSDDLIRVGKRLGFRPEHALHGLE